MFRSVSYRHVPNQLRRKLDDKGDQSILVGYHSTCGYKLYDIVNKKTVIIRDVIFDGMKDWQHMVVKYKPDGVEYLKYGII